MWKRSHHSGSSSNLTDELLDPLFYQPDPFLLKYAKIAYVIVKRIHA